MDRYLLIQITSLGTYEVIALCKNFKEANKLFKKYEEEKGMIPFTFKDDKFEILPLNERKHNFKII